jgi:hypothetical protein
MPDAGDAQLRLLRAEGGGERWGAFFTPERVVLVSLAGPAESASSSLWRSSLSRPLSLSLPFPRLLPALLREVCGRWSRDDRNTFKGL